jgi:transposase
MAISESVRQEAVVAYLGQAGTMEWVAAHYGMSVGSLQRFVARHRFALGLSPSRRGRPPTYTAAELELLRAHVQQVPDLCVPQALQFLVQHTGKQVSRSTAEQLLQMLKTKPPRRAPSATAAPPASPKKSAPKGPPTQTRYTDAHRREEPGRYPTDLTDAEWQLLEEHFQPTDKGGRPPDHPPRLMLDAIFYVLRSGCPWRMMPHDFPPWKSVYTAFRRWMADGRLRKAHDALRRKLRVRLGRKEDPTALIVDSRSVKTTEKGGPEATTPARRSTGESSTSRSIPKDC